MSRKPITIKITASVSNDGVNVGLNAKQLRKIVTNISVTENKRVSSQYGLRSCRNVKSNSSEEEVKIIYAQDNSNIVEEHVPNYNFRKRPDKNLVETVKSPVPKFVSDEKNVPNYNLRKRTVEYAVKPATKRVRLEIVKNHIPKFVSAIPDILTVGMLVLAKMPTYSAWPAQIEEIRPNKRVIVIFLGENSKGTVKIEQIGLVGENVALIQATLSKKIKNFAKAVKELESMQNVPQHLSIFQNCKCRK